MLEAARIYKEPRYLASAEKGGEFMLLSQMPEPQPGWAQQYDREMHPAWARQFEPPSITGGESQSVMRALMLLYRETGQRKYLEPLPRALAYYKRSILPDVENPSEIRRRACPGRTPCAARFYELKTNRPAVCDERHARDRRRTRRDERRWLRTELQRPVGDYPLCRADFRCGIRRDRTRVQRASESRRGFAQKAGQTARLVAVDESPAGADRR